MRNLILLWLAGIFSAALHAQIGIGQWRTHLTYNNGSCVTVAGSKVYCGTKEGLFSYNYDNAEVEKYTKPDGFAGIGVRATGYSSKSGAVIFVYDDCNIDIYKGNDIINLPQVKNYSTSGDKTVNNVTIEGDSAIISLGFGVVIVDMNKEIIKTDVKFSDDASFAFAKCYDAAIMNGRYYFATSQGVYSVPYSSNIKDLTLWQLIPGLPNGTFNTLADIGGKLYLNYSNYITNGIDLTDTLYQYDGVVSTVFEAGWMARIMDISNANNHLVILSDNEAKSYNASGVLQDYITGCFTVATKAESDADGGIWISCGSGGLAGTRGGCATYYQDGPFSKNVWDMQVVKGDLWAAAGGVTVSWANAYIAEKMYYRRDGDWKWLNIPDLGAPDPHIDIHTLLVDPNNAGHVYAGSWGSGFYEVTNYNTVSQYRGPYLDSTNTVASLTFRVGGIARDSKGNIWMTNANTDKALKVKYANNTWGEFSLLPYASASSTVGKIEIDTRNQAWIAVPGKGIVVIDLDVPGTYRLLKDAYNSGDLPDVNVRAIECDKDGSIWVGTHDGLRIFSTSQVFPVSNAVNGQKIVLKDGSGINELLLKETIINDIETDGGNRKWIATMGTGVRLVSDDGRQIIHSFTAENSPLLSNNVLCIAIDEESGEVYFGTDKGIISFRSDATSADNSFGDVYAFPNPVHPDYEGTIAITGMANDAIVKITDISGNLVYETKAEGGTATWNGKKYDGKRPSTGVYLVFCVNEDASQTMITKILFIN